MTILQLGCSNNTLLCVCRLHLACLVMQLAGNFSLLGEFDDLLSRGSKSGGILSASTALAWGASLAASPAPTPVKVAAIASIAAGWKLGPRLRLHWVNMTAAMGVVVALAIETHVLKKSPFGPTFAGVVAAHLGLWKVLSSPGWRGCLSAYKGPVTAAALSALAAAASKEDPVALVVLLGSFTLWPLSLLTDTPALAFYGLGYLATAAQGAAHAMSGEAATLVRLNAEMVGGGAQAAKVAYEWGHVVFFPNLLLQAASKAFGFS